MVIIPINGLNSRMGSLFKTPKHLLLYKGRPAIEHTVEYMTQFGEVRILANEIMYYDKLKEMFGDIVVPVVGTDNVIDTIKQGPLKGPIWIVDCDIVPVNLNIPIENTVYCFKNNGPNQYSNFMVDVDYNVLDCNEKGYRYDYCGAGIYYFSSADQLTDNMEGCTSVSHVVRKCNFKADVTSEIFRLGSLPDITGGFTGNEVEKTMTKRGKTTFAEWTWYRAYEDKNDIPRILGFFDDTLTMELVEEEGPIEVNQVADLIEKYRYYPKMNDLDFEIYIKRIEGHLQSNRIANGQKLLKELTYCNPQPSFAHGDLSVTNVIQSSTGPKLIDPLYSDKMFGSHVLDQAKFLFSLKFYRNDLKNYELFLQTVNFPRINALIASECVRVATYNKNFNFIAENLINEL
jgi:hypothetical protein